MRNTIILLAFLPVFAQTLHEGETGGQLNTVTVYTQSHVHIDKGMATVAGLGTIRDNEIVRHGHEGPRILRVLFPELQKGNYKRGLKGTTIEENDIVEIELLDRSGNNASLGILKLTRTDKDNRGETLGFLTSGHTLGSDKLSLSSCAQACEARPGREYSPTCADQASQIKASLGSNPSKWLWIYTFEETQPLKWIAKTPSESAMRQIIADKVPDKIKFQFGLVKAVPGKPDDPEALWMGKLSVRRAGGGEPFVETMTAGARFQVCDYDEITGKSKCDPIPACQGFWQRHFNSTCRLYGGEGVFRRPKGKHPHHTHH